jgi:hypothetical protein
MYSGGREMDGFIGDREGALTEAGASWCSAIIEFENELGATSSDKYFQGQGYYGLVSTRNHLRPARLCSSFPAFLIEIQGPYLRYMEASIVVGDVIE